MKGIPAYQIAIIGTGPKGLYCLERLLAQISHANLHDPITIHLFNKTPFFGAGDIYRPDQPGYLLMNFTNRNIDLRPNAPPTSTVHIQPYTEWLQHHRIDNCSKADDFSSRATVGKYYIDHLNKLLRNRPDHLTIQKHVGEVIDIIAQEQHYTLLYQRGRKEIFTLPRPIHQIMLTTGHGGNMPQPTKWSDHDSFIPHVYPVDEKLGGIPPGSKIGIKGLGLTFIDTVLALTEGRGGTFHRQVNKMKYVPSGQEPRLIFPFSRSGLPMIPKKGTDPNPELRYFTREKIRPFKDPVTNRYPFEKKILPLIHAEIEFQYYRKLFHDHGLTLRYEDSFDIVKEQISAFHKSHPAIRPFSFKDLCHPIAEPHDHRAVEQHISELIDHASISGPWSTAAAVWRSISPVFSDIYRFGGLDASGHRAFDQRFFGVFNRVSYGPPLENMRKILALTHAGYLNFSFAKSPTVHPAPNGRFELRKTLNTSSIQVDLDVLIDARIPKTNLDSGSVLWQNLLKRKLISPYQNNDAHASYSPGCTALTRQGNPVTPSQEVVPTLTLYGTPTEGITFDNDTLSRTRNNMADQWSNNIIHDIKSYYATYRSEIESDDLSKRE